MKREIKKAALRQTEKGMLITFVLHHAEDNSDLVNAPVGSVFHATFEAEDEAP